MKNEHFGPDDETQSSQTAAFLTPLPVNHEESCVSEQQSSKSSQQPARPLEGEQPSLHLPPPWDTLQVPWPPRFGRRPVETPLPEPFHAPPQQPLHQPSYQGDNWASQQAQPAEGHVWLVPHYGHIPLQQFWPLGTQFLVTPPLYSTPLEHVPERQICDISSEQPILPQGQFVPPNQYLPQFPLHTRQTLPPPQEQSISGIAAAPSTSQSSSATVQTRVSGQSASALQTLSESLEIHTRSLAAETCMSRQHRSPPQERTLQFEKQSTIPPAPPDTAPSERRHGTEEPLVGGQQRLHTGAQHLAPQQSDSQVTQPAASLAGSESPTGVPLNEMFQTFPEIIQSLPDLLQVLIAIEETWKATQDAWPALQRVWSSMQQAWPPLQQILRELRNKLAAHQQRLQEQQCNFPTQSRHNCTVTPEMNTALQTQTSPISAAAQSHERPEETKIEGSWWQTGAEGDRGKGDHEEIDFSSLKKTATNSSSARLKKADFVKRKPPTAVRKPALAFEEPSKVESKSEEFPPKLAEMKPGFPISIPHSPPVPTATIGKLELNEIKIPLQIPWPVEKEPKVPEKTGEPVTNDKCLPKSTRRRSEIPPLGLKPTQASEMKRAPTRSPLGQMSAKEGSLFVKLSVVPVNELQPFQKEAHTEGIERTSAGNQSLSSRKQLAPSDESMLLNVVQPASLRQPKPEPNNVGSPSSGQVPTPEEAVQHSEIVLPANRSPLVFNISETNFENAMSDSKCLTSSEEESMQPIGKATTKGPCFADRDKVGIAENFKFSSKEPTAKSLCSKKNACEMRAGLGELGDAPQGPKPVVQRFTSEPQVPSHVLKEQQTTGKGLARRTKQSQCPALKAKTEVHTSPVISFGLVLPPVRKKQRTKKARKGKKQDVTAQHAASGKPPLKDERETGLSDSENEQEAAPEDEMAKLTGSSCGGGTDPTQNALKYGVRNAEFGPDGSASLVQKVLTLQKDALSLPKGVTRPNILEPEVTQKYGSPPPEGRNLVPSKKTANQKTKKTAAVRDIKREKEVQAQSRKPETTVKETTPSSTKPATLLAELNPRFEDRTAEPKALESAPNVLVQALSKEDSAALDRESAPTVQVPNLKYEARSLDSDEPRGAPMEPKRSQEELPQKPKARDNQSQEPKLSENQSQDETQEPDGSSRYSESAVEASELALDVPFQAAAPMQTKERHGTSKKEEPKNFHRAGHHQRHILHLHSRVHGYRYQAPPWNSFRAGTPFPRWPRPPHRQLYHFPHSRPRMDVPGYAPGPLNGSAPGYPGTP